MSTTAYQLLGVLRHYAPTGVAQEQCSDFYSLLQREGLRGRELDLRLVNALRDGLAHGNWLWGPLPPVADPAAPQTAPAAPPTPGGAAAPSEGGA